MPIVGTLYTVGGVPYCPGRPKAMGHSKVAPVASALVMLCDLQEGPLELIYATSTSGSPLRQYSFKHKGTGRGGVPWAA